MSESCNFVATPRKSYHPRYLIITRVRFPHFKTKIRSDQAHPPVWKYDQTSCFPVLVLELRVFMCHVRLIRLMTVHTTIRMLVPYKAPPLSRNAINVRAREMTAQIWVGTVLDHVTSHHWEIVQNEARPWCKTNKRIIANNTHEHTDNMVKALQTLLSRRTSLDSVSLIRNPSTGIRLIYSQFKSNQRVAHTKITLIGTYTYIFQALTLFTHGYLTA